MPRDDTFHLRYMLEAAQISLSFAQGRTRDSLDDDLLFFYALVKAVEIIGEAASHLTDDFKAQHPEVEWRDIIGMRNRLVHVYYDINHDLLWRAAQDDVPALIPQLEAAIQQRSG